MQVLKNQNRPELLIEDMDLSKQFVNIPDSDFPREVIIGAGFAGLSIVKKLENKDVQIVLLYQNNFHQFQPLLYQDAISGLEADSIVSSVSMIFKIALNQATKYLTYEKANQLILRKYEPGSNIRF